MYFAHLNKSIQRTAAWYLNDPIRVISFLSRIFQFPFRLNIIRLEWSAVVILSTFQGPLRKVINCQSEISETAMSYSKPKAFKISE